MQSEVQQLICDILRATPDATSAESAAQTARLASKTPITNFKNPFGVKNKEERYAAFIIHHSEWGDRFLFS